MHVHNENCLDTMQRMTDNSIDAIITDPPYGIKFMGNKWDYDVPTVDIWQECIRVLKPGGHLLAFAGTRTQHRMAVNIEDAGFEIRDMIAWAYGSGFPKSHNISKAISKAAGTDIDAARAWEGWGTALKPAIEPITVARKPLAPGNTVAANVLQYGTAGINIDACRVPTTDAIVINTFDDGAKPFGDAIGQPFTSRVNTDGRFPANIIHDGSNEVLEMFPNCKGEIRDGHGTPSGFNKGSNNSGKPATLRISDRGSAARFFYCAKASRIDRGPDNTHPTVKPTDLMKYLVKLVTPPDGIVYDPFAGSGSTGKACAILGMQFVGSELNAEFVAIARARIDAERNNPIQGLLWPR